MPNNRRYSCVCCGKPVPDGTSTVQCKACQALSLALSDLHLWYEREYGCEADDIGRGDRVRQHIERVEIERSPLFGMMDAADQE